MTYLITLLDKNGKYAVYTGGNIPGIYHYLEMNRAQTKLTTSGQRYHNFGHSYSINNYTETLQTFIEYLRMRQKSICECCGRI